MGTQAALRLGIALMPVIERVVGTCKRVYSMQLNRWILRSPQVLRWVFTLKLLRGSAKTERVVVYVCVRNIGYMTGIGVHVSGCQEGVYISAYKLAVASLPPGMGD